MNYFAGSVRSGRAHIATWAAWLVLLIVQVLDAWQLQLPWIIWLGKVIPLLIFLPGMLRNNLRSYIWLCFVSLMYFLVLVERLFAQPDLLALIGMVAVVVLFNAAMLFVRWRARELKENKEHPRGAGDT